MVLDYGTTMKADDYVGSQIGWGIQFKSVPERDSFKAYAVRIKAREAAGRARAGRRPDRPAT